MKKLLGIVVLGLLWCNTSVAADIKLTRETTINDLLNNGYKIINVDLVKESGSRIFIKVFTLQDRNSRLIICNLKFDHNGYLDDKFCIKP